MSADLLRRLTRLSEAGDGAVLSGAEARRHRGAAFDRLLARRALVERAPLTDWEVCGDCECGIDFRPIERVGGTLRAVCPLDPSEDVILEEDDLRSFEIDADVLAEFVAEAAGFAAPPQTVAAGLWRIGTLKNAGRVVFLALDAYAMAGNGGLALLARARRGAPATLLTPALPTEVAGRCADADIDVVELGRVLEEATGVPGWRIRSASLEPASDDPSLVVRPATGEIAWKGLHVALSHQVAPVLERLARHALSGRSALPHQEVEGATGRAARDLIRDLRHGLTAGGLSKNDAEALTRNVHGRGYRMDLMPEQIRIED